MSARTRIDAVSAAVCGGAPLHEAPKTQVVAQAAAAGGAGRRLRIAAVVTEYRRYSHAQHICDRFLMGYGWGNTHHMPAMDLAGIFIDQSSEGHCGPARAEEFPALTVFPTIEAALYLGGASLAVDGVLLIGEHGTYEQNEMGQTLYPRYEFFVAVADVFRADGRTAPVFSDKHLCPRPPPGTVTRP